MAKGIRVSIIKFVDALEFILCEVSLSWRLRPSRELRGPNFDLIQQIVNTTIFSGRRRVGRPMTGRTERRARCLGHTHTHTLAFSNMTCHDMKGVRRERTIICLTLHIEWHKDEGYQTWGGEGGNISPPSPPRNSPRALDTGGSGACGCRSTMCNRQHTQACLNTSLSIRQEIQRFESVHPSIYALYDLVELVPDPLLAQQIRDHVVAIEGRLFRAPLASNGEVRL
ncbi:Centaurin-gamma-1A [Papilio xuthus]|uniref:Centaurin-gamma-1A n=1 Tax=Papilio xuthus TaxID=66420 RepID=A0A194QIT0_PAPXU|nr:Centaurin-gamma-1A [Papilio xuthus]